MIKFPENFICEPHPFSERGWEYRKAKQWRYVKPNGSIISVVGGAAGLYGDGVNTFELWDFDQEEPKGYLTVDEINDYLKSLEGYELIKPLKNNIFTLS
jgi:hypothetical protein